MDREKFVQASVRIRNLEKKLLTKIQFERLYEAENLEEAVRHLNETAYSEDLAKIDRAENFEIALSNSLNRTYSEVLKLSPVKELVDVLTYRFAFHNIKLAVKEKILQENFEHIYSKVHYEDLPKLKKQFETEKGEKGTWYEDTVIQAYKVFEDTKDPEKIEFFVDKRYFEKVLEVSEEQLTRAERSEQKFTKPEPTPYFLTLLCSLAISLLSVVNPLLTNLATNLQSQNLYAGWAMTQGQVPYSQIYGTSGLLYYLMAWTSSLAFGQLLWMVFQTLALWMAGLFLYKTLVLLQPKQDLSRSLLLLFYLLVFALGFGGLYSSIFVLPFIFWNLSFLVRYLQDSIKDEKFIAYGAFGALAFMIDPVSSLVFYSLTALVLLVYNIAAKRAARGFYQLLAGLFGFSVIFYPIGYFTVANRTFGQAISQVTYSWDSISLIGSHSISNLVYYGLLTVGLGFISALGVNLFPREKGQATSLRVLRFIGLLGLFITVFAAFILPDQGSYQLLPALPFAMILFYYV